MKTSLVIASVLLAGVALEAAAFRINNNENQGDNHKQWSRYQQGDSGEGSLAAFEQNDDQLSMNKNREQYNQKMNLNSYNSNTDNVDQYSQKSNRNNYSNNEDRVQYNQKLNRNNYNNNEDRDQYNPKLNLNNYNNNNNNENRGQFNQRLNHNNKHYNNNNDYYNNDDDKYNDGFDSAEQQQRYQSQNPTTTVDRSAGLTRKMVEKIAALQKIARDNHIAGPAAYLTGALTVADHSAKLSGQEHVTFFDGTVKRLDDGRLDYLYVNPVRDAVVAQYYFDRLAAAGSFRSNMRDARAGRYTVVMDGVTCNVTTAFDEGHGVALAAVRPARFASADVAVQTADGAETRALDAALEHKYLAALRMAVSAEVAAAAGRDGPIAQMKRAVREPFARVAGDKLYDMRWTEDDVSMEMARIGSQNAKNGAEPKMRLSSASFSRKSEYVYRMRYHFAIDDLAWSSPLTVEWAGKRTAVRSADFGVDQVNVYVTVDKSYGQQQQQQQHQQQQQQRLSCGQVNTNVEVTGLLYNFNENVPSEFVTKVENKLQRFIEHSLEKYVQESLKQELCQGNAQ